MRTLTRHGVALLLTYKIGSTRMVEAREFTVDLRWIGLRPSQVYETELPEDAFQAFRSTDNSKVRSMLQSDFMTRHPAWREEVETMSEMGLKCELEALNYLGMVRGRMAAVRPWEPQ